MYLLDANTYIQAKNFYYRMTTVPGFWEWLDRQMTSGSVGTISPIFDELTKGNDRLSGWAKDRKAFVLSVDDSETQAVFAEVAEDVVNHAAYAEPHTSAFLDGADPWLIAKAKTTGATVITHERRVGSDSKKVKIPNLCDTFSIPYHSAYDLMDLFEVKLVLAPA